MRNDLTLRFRSTAVKITVVQNVELLSLKFEIL